MERTPYKASRMARSRLAPLLMGCRPRIRQIGTLTQFIDQLRQHCRAQPDVHTVRVDLDSRDEALNDACLLGGKGSSQSVSIQGFADLGFCNSRHRLSRRLPHAHQGARNKLGS